MRVREATWIASNFLHRPQNILILGNCSLSTPLPKYWGFYKAPFYFLDSWYTLTTPPPPPSLPAFLLKMLQRRALPVFSFCFASVASFSGLSRPPVVLYWQILGAAMVGNETIVPRHLCKIGPGYEAIISFMYCKRSKLEVGEGLGTRLQE